MTEQEMKKLGYQVIDAIVEHHKTIASKKVSTPISYEELKPKVKSELPLTGEDAQSVFKELSSLISENISHLDHPRFFSFIPGPGNYYSVLADTLAKGYNVFAGHWLGGAYAAMVETQTLEWLRKLVGFPQSGGGIFVSGGSMANLTALVAARENKLPDKHTKGTVYYSEQTHSSLAKALRIIGFKAENMRKIGTDEKFRMNTEELARKVSEDINNGYTPFCLVGNAGTTNTGVVDNLHQLAKIACEYGMWFHIDAAYGGAVVLSQEYKNEISGIEKADSVTLDPHKWWFQPYEIGCLLVRNKGTLKEAFSVEAEYLEDTVNEEKEINYYEYGIQLTRSFRALKLYAFFRCVGFSKIGKEITKGIKNAEYIEFLLGKHPHWQTLSKASLGIISFRAKTGDNEAVNDALNNQISQYLLKNGYATITTTRLKGHVALRMCPIHPETTHAFLNKTFEHMNDFIKKNSGN